MRAGLGEKSLVAYRVSLPHGCWRGQDGDPPVREVTIRAVDEQDDPFLIDTADVRPGARGTALIARCLVDEPEPADFAGSLTVGDREALLLHLRRLTLGDRIDVRVRCPARACREQMDVSLAVDSLLTPQYEDVRQEYDFGVEVQGSHHEVRFRLPTAADLEPTRSSSGVEVDRQAREILACCLVRATMDGVPERANELPDEVHEAVGAEMLRRDPQAELELDLKCPACGAEFAIVLDTATLVLRELDERAVRLMHEIHVLASRYHWSERSILRIPARRRAQYIELLFAETTRAAREATAW